MENELTLTVDYKIPPTADDLGELFAALGRDYDDLTGGRTLVVSRVESGSWIATLTDIALAATPYVKNALAVGGAIKGIADLAKLLKSLLEKAKSNPPEKPSKRRGRKKPGVRSLEAMLKVAANCDGVVRGSYKSPEGETLDFEVSSLEAIRIREGARASAETMNTVPAISKPDLTRPAKAVESTRPPPGIQSSLQRVYQVGDEALSDSELEQIAEILIAAIEGTGSTYLIDQIIGDLQSRGLHKFAQILQQRAQRSQRNTEPPLTTT